VDCHSFFSVKYYWSEEVGQAFIRNPALPLERNMFLYNTQVNYFPYKYAIVISNENILEMFQAGRQSIYSYPKRFGALGYISDSNRNTEGLQTTADNGEHIENSMKSSRSDKHVKM
jgi:hypothetical protein